MVRKFQFWSAWIVGLELFGGLAWLLNRPTDSPKLVQAVRQVESGGNEQKVGDKRLRHKAYTSLQIRQPALKDVNRLFAKEIRKIFGQKELTVAYLKQNREALDWVFEKYTGYYARRERLGREPTDEDRARIWNGGPDGWKEAKDVASEKAKRKAARTKRYAQKVLTVLT